MNSEISSATPSSSSPTVPVKTAPEKKRGVLSTLGFIALFIVAKLKWLLLSLKAGSLAKVFITMGSMAAMVWLEATRSGWWFGFGFVVMILVHELGHGYAIKKAGLKAGWPVFIPFFGAMISLKETPRSPLVEADIALGGPIWGTAVSTLMVGFYILTHSRLPLALAYAGFFLNLFNMTPIGPLDGGRVARVFSRRIWILGAVVIGGLFFLTQAPQLILIALIALMHSWGKKAEGEVITVTKAQQRWVAAKYLGLTIYLGVATYFAHHLLTNTPAL